MKLFSSIVLSLVLMLGAGFAVQHVSAQTAAMCTTTGGYNATTGMSCNGVTTILAGCSSTAGFSATTGLACNGGSNATNGFDGTMVGPNGFLNGCTSTAGYSTTTGYACSTAMNGIIYTGNGTTVNTNAAPVPATSVATTSPGLPTTGAGQDTVLNLALLLGSAGVAFIATRYAIRHSARTS